MTSAPRRSGRPSTITALGLTGAPATPAPITPPALPDPTPPATRPRDAGGPATSPAPADQTRPTVAYTLRLTAEESLAADELTMTARRTTGRRIERSALIRALLQLAANDPALLTRACDVMTPRRHGVTDPTAP
jgi:hypothetical protein